MPEHVDVIFENTKQFMKRMNQKKFVENFDLFTENYGYLFQEMVDYVGKAEDKDKAAREVGDAIVDASRKTYGKGSKGNLTGSAQTDLNMFMIIYVFPSIFRTGHEDSETTADGVLAIWNERKSTGPDIGYVEYDKLYDGFKRKLFGIF